MLVIQTVLSALNTHMLNSDTQSSVLGLLLLIHHVQSRLQLVIQAPLNMHTLVLRRLQPEITGSHHHFLHQRMICFYSLLVKA